MKLKVDSSFCGSRPYESSLDRRNNFIVSNEKTFALEQKGIVEEMLTFECRCKVVFDLLNVYVTPNHIIILAKEFFARK